MSLDLFEVVAIAALLAGISALALVVYRTFALRQAAEAAAGPDTRIADLIRDGEERLTAMVAMMDASQQARLDSLKQEISAVKSDIDWLTGERMIEQAIMMAREGVPAEEISSDLGLSFDAAHTISVMRRH